MSQYLIHDQELLFKSCTEIKTEIIDNNSEYELITCEKSKTPKQIRQAYLRSNLDPLDKAIEKGSKYVRKYFNDKNLKRRVKKGNWIDRKKI